MLSDSRTLPSPAPRPRVAWLICGVGFGLILGYPQAQASHYDPFILGGVPADMLELPEPERTAALARLNEARRLRKEYDLICTRLAVVGGPLLGAVIMNVIGSCLGFVPTFLGTLTAVSTCFGIAALLCVPNFFYSLDVLELQEKFGGQTDLVSRFGLALFLSLPAIPIGGVIDWWRSRAG